MTRKTPQGGQATVTQQGAGHWVGDSLSGLAAITVQARWPHKAEGKLPCALARTCLPAMPHFPSAQA